MLSLSCLSALLSAQSPPDTGQVWFERPAPFVAAFAAAGACFSSCPVRKRPSSGLRHRAQARSRIACSPLAIVLLCSIASFHLSAVEALAVVGGRVAKFESIEKYGEGSPLRELGNAVGHLGVVLDDFGQASCTAFLIADSIAMTAAYCVGSPNKPAQSLSLRMGFVGRESRADSRAYTAKILEVSDTAGFALLKVAGNPGREWGKLRLAGESLAEGSPLIVLHHPAGQPLQVTRLECRHIRSASHRLLHSCDTLGGSGGAPLIDVATSSVVGMHHSGGDPNEAIPVAAILQASEVARASSVLLTAEVEPKPINIDTIETPPVSRGVRQISVVSPDDEEVFGYAESHALLIGVSDYTGAWSRLPKVPRDIREVEIALKRHGFATTVVMDPDLDELQQNIQDFIFDFGADRENRLLFYYAGHGESLELADGRLMGYLVMRDAPFAQQDASLFRRRALSMTRFESFAKDIVAKHALFIFDSCFSGTVFSALRGAPDSITRKTAEPVRQFITSGTEEQEVPDSSIFRLQLVRGLSGEADLNRDGYVTGSELGSFLEDTVTNLTRSAQTPIYGKIPDAVLGRGDFVFVPPER